MDWRTEQQKEIETIRDRVLTISLSDADVRRLWEKSGAVGITVSELIENFIGDLVDGTYNNGSDERNLAQRWFSRCGFEMFTKKTFLRYIIEFGYIDETIELLEYIKMAKEELEYSTSHQDEFTKEEIESWKEELVYSDEKLNDIFTDFKEWAKDEHTDTLEVEVGNILNWHNKMISFVN